MHSRSTTTTFKLSSLFLVTTLAAIAAGVFSANVVVGVLLLIVAGPALVRTIMVISRRKMLGRDSTAREKLVEFIHSMSMVVLLLVFIVITLWAALIGATLFGAALITIGEGARQGGEVVGALVGVALSGWLLWWVWHRITTANRAELATALNNEGAVCRERGETDRAMALFTEAAELNPKLAAPHINRAYAYSAKEEWAAALAAIDLAIALEPGRALLHSDRGVMLLNSGSPDAALVSLNTAIQLDANLGVAYSNRGMAHLAQRALADAADDFEAAIRLDPGCPIAFNNRGFIKAAQGVPSGAIEDYETAIRLAPDHPNAHKNLAWILATSTDARFRNGAKALAHAQRAIELAAGTKPQWLEILAAAFAECGDFEAALAWQTKAIEASGAPATDEMSKRLAGYARWEPHRS